MAAEHSKGSSDDVLFLIRREVTKKCLVSFLLAAAWKRSSEHLPAPTPKSGISGAKSTKELMSNECFTLPQLILSLPLLWLSRYTEVIMTLSSIILLSLLFSWNCLIICYRFVFTPIILPVICSVSSYKHTAHFRWPFFEDYCQWHLRDAQGIGSIISVAMGNYTDLSVMAKSTTSNSVLRQREHGFLSCRLDKSSWKFMLIQPF